MEGMESMKESVERMANDREKLRAEEEKLRAKLEKPQAKIEKLLATREKLLAESDKLRARFLQRRVKRTAGGSAAAPRPTPATIGAYELVHVKTTEAPVWNRVDRE